MDPNQIENKIAELFQSGKFLREKDIEKIKNPAPDTEWLKNNINLSGRIHHEEYEALRFFDKPNDIILDIGANWGYSVVSMRNSGVKTKIVSFEVNPFFKKYLEVFRENDFLYNYIILGLSNTIQESDFIIPIKNGTLQSALCCQVNDFSAKNIANELANKNDDETLDVAIYSFTAKTHKLDELVSKNYRNLFDGRIAAMKIDVEGHEEHVLHGARRTINLFRPVILIEGANRRPDIDRFFKEFNYKYYDYKNGTLIRTDSKSTAINGLYIDSSSDYPENFV